MLVDSPRGQGHRRMDTNLLALYQDDWVQKCLSIASYSCLVYDHALTFDKEIEFIWQAPWTFTKVVFLLNRYGNFIGQTVIQFVKLTNMMRPTAETCDLPNEFLALYIVSAIESIHILVLLRAWAIWGCEKRAAMMLIGSYSLYLLFFIIKSTFTTISVSTLTFKYANLHEICVTEIPGDSWLLPLATGSQDTFVFLFTMISLWRHSKTSQNLYPTSLLFVLIRDGVIFYITCFFFAVFNATTWLRYPSNPKNMLFLTFAVNLLSIAGQRFVLNLRGFTVRTYGARSISAEVDRQLQLFSGTQGLEWWNTSTHQSGSSRLEHRRKKGVDIERDGSDHDRNMTSSDVVETDTTEEADLAVEP